MKIHVSVATLFFFKVVASLHLDAATSHLHAVLVKPAKADHTNANDQRDLVAKDTGTLTV
jgi:hypothetical protein